MTHRKRAQAVVLDDETLGLFGGGLVPAELPEGEENALFSRILARIDARKSSEEAGLITVRADEGKWFPLAPKLEKKLLFTDTERRVEAYLLRLKPGAVVPEHRHTADEYCVVLDGEVFFGDLHLKAGDFHLARKGSIHGAARSGRGALLYLEGPLANVP